MFIYGPVGPDYGTASVTLNGQIVAPSLNLTVRLALSPYWPSRLTHHLQSSWPLDYGLLWFQTGLDPGVETDVTLTNLENKKMGVDFFVLSAEPDLTYSLCAF